MDMTVHKGKRWSAAQAYLRPALKRKNLSTETGALVYKIVMHGDKAVGIEYEVGKLYSCTFSLFVLNQKIGAEWVQKIVFNFNCDTCQNYLEHGTKIN